MNGEAVILLLMLGRTFFLQGEGCGLFGFFVTFLSLMAHAVILMKVGE